MSKTTPTLEILLERAFVEMQSEWATLVCLALRINPDGLDEMAARIAKRTKVGQDSIKRKLSAIQYQATLGLSEAEIIAQGQEKVLGGFIKSRKQATYQETVTMKWSVPGSQRELIQQQEKRVKTLLGIYTSEEFWDWWLAQVRNASDEEIRQSAGETQ